MIKTLPNAFVKTLSRPADNGIVSSSSIVLLTMSRWWLCPFTRFSYSIPTMRSVLDACANLQNNVLAMAHPHTMPFSSHNEEPFQGEEAGDRSSFYRALARLTIGVPTKYKSISSCVVERYLGALIDTARSFNSEYKSFDALYRPFTNTTFFDALICPDLALCPYGKNRPQSRRVLLIIAPALNFGTVIRKDHGTFAYQKRHAEAPECNFRFSVLGHGKCEHRYSSLTVANDGRALVGLLQKRKQELCESWHTFQESPSRIPIFS